MPNPLPEPPEHQNLGGEAPQGLYGFEDEAGHPVIGGEGVIPILEEIGEHRYKFIGTGFFITDFGVFITARHVITPAQEQGHRIFTWQLIPPNEWHISPVVQWRCHTIADIAIGVRCQAVHEETHEPLVNARLPLTTRAHFVGDLVATYAYPNTDILTNEAGQTLSFNPASYEGNILEHHPDGRDSLILPGPCYRTSIVIHHGASGGPVFGRSGAVFALNSTKIDGTDDSYVSSIQEALSLSITIEGDHGVEELTIQQLADRGYAIVNP